MKLEVSLSLTFSYAKPEIVAAYCLEFCVVLATEPPRFLS